MSAAFHQALAKFQRGDLAGAEADVRALIKAQPRNADATHLLAGVLHARGDLADALPFFDKAAKLAPSDVAIAFNRAACLTALERHADALAAYDTLLKLKPNDPEALYNRGVTLAALKRPADALTSYDAARAAGFVSQGRADALTLNRGIALAGLGQLEQALAHFDAALRRDPRDVKAHVNRGAALDGLERFDDAVAAYDAAIALAPDHAKAWMQRGAALSDSGRFDAALQSAQAALRLAPDRFDLRRDYASLLMDAGRAEAAIEAFRALVDEAPDDPDLQYSLAYSYLRVGDYRRGFRLYEGRWGVQKQERAQPLGQPHLGVERLWLGQQDIAGKRLLVRDEQGFGDLFQFCRFLPGFARRGAHVILQARACTLDLMRSLDGVAEYVAQDAPAPEFDLHMPLVSAPLAIGLTLETIPTAPYLHAAPERIAFWRERLDARWGQRRRVRVGVVWRGGQLSRFQRRRTLPLEGLRALIAAEADWVSLQMDGGDAQALLDEKAVAQFGAEIKPFTEMAALTASLDLIVSVDTGAAHLAGALGMPVLLLTPYAPEWRWMLEREDTPWYPTMRLLRQQSYGDWSRPIAQAHAAIAALQP